jgi:opacity protein-like surface antigen
MRHSLLPGFACGLLGAVSPALAADMPVAVPVIEAPVALGGWYLRGDVGFTHQQVDGLDNPYWATAGTVTVTSADFSPSYFFGAGVGYQFNSWFRTDVTLEYRAQSDFDGGDTYVNAVPANGVNNFDSSKTEVVGLLNAYVDIGTWGGVTPFIGAGIGFGHIMMGGLTDNGFDSVGGQTSGSASSKSQNNLAWALMAGLGYQVAPGVTLEASYRYLWLGDAQSGTLTDSFGGTFGNLEYQNIDSQDVRFSVRWALGGPVAPTPEPIISK